MRDHLKTHSYWQEFLAKESQMRAKFSGVPDDATKSIETRQRVAYRIFRSSFISTVATYSSGQDRPSLRQALLQTLGDFDSFLNTCDLAIARARSEYSGGYDSTYSMFGLSVLMGLSHNDTAPLARGLKFFDVRDAIWEAFLEWLGYPKSGSTPGLVWPEAYSALDDALRSPPPDNAIALQQFVQGWYHAMRETSWYDSHRSIKLTYFGYWCFEGAAVARMRKIDVSQLRDHPHFPTDLLP